MIVGLGASAGGLEPLQQFFASVPASTGLTFVVVQHLDPRRPSLLPELLARQASVPVVEAANGVRPEPDHIYVVAAGTRLTLDKDALQVTESPEPTADDGPIDAFFRSLAAAKGERAVAIVLSGAGYDGTVGLRAIKERGGVTLAQAPETATHDSMPLSVIEAGLADHVGTPAQLAAAVLEHAGHVTTAEESAATLEAPIAAGLGRICTLVSQHTGHDFVNYKHGTLVRRIRRRMQVLRVPTVDAYVGLLEQGDGEAHALVKDLLIGVTQFFRDPEGFRALAQQVIPWVVERRPAEAPVRIWVPGCASGEEAYSIAILLREHLERVGSTRFAQIFATDLDPEMLAKARAGRYPASIADRVGPERLARFFTRDDRGYRASAELREMCIFSQHSVIRDPPFSQIDLISCRNVLIYFSTGLQKKLVPLFHYALRPGGFLFLGPSEGLAGSPELFEIIDKSNRILRRRESPVRPVVDFPLAVRHGVRPAPVHPVPPAGADTPPSPQRITAAFERSVLDEYAAPCALVNERGDLLLVAGRLDRYFRLPSGAVTTNLVDLVPRSLRGELRRALTAAASRRRRVVRDIEVTLEDAVHRVRLTVRPVPDPEAGSGLFLVALEDHAPLDAPEKAEEAAVEADEPALDRLEGELRTTRAELRTAVEDLESANEELKSSNEELISTNEELQSANEELQTSQEELQSLNEELETINAELRQKVDELDAANADLQNLFASTEIAAIFLDRDLRVARFTPAATSLFRLRESDVGRPIGDLAPRFHGEDLVGTARQVLHTLDRVERRVRTGDGASFILRTIPYRTVEGAVAGAVVTFVDVSALDRAEEALRRTTERERLLAETLEQSTTPFGLGAPDGRLLLFNRAFAELTGYSREELEDLSLSWSATLTPPEWREGEAEVLAGAVRQRTSVRYQKEYVRKDGTRVPVELVVQPVFAGDGTLLHYRSFLTDVSERRRAEAERERLASQRQLALDAAMLGWWHYDPVTRVASWDEGYRRIFGVEGDSRLNDEILADIIHPDDLPGLWAKVEAALESGATGTFDAEYRIRRPDGAVRWVEAHGVATFEGAGGDRRATSFVGTVADVTERKASESRLAYLASFPEQNPNPIVEADGQGRVTYANPTARGLFPDLEQWGTAHPWLAGWESLAGSIQENPAASRSRELSVGDRVYHQSFLVLPEVKTIRVYGIDITERARAESARTRAEAAAAAAHLQLQSVIDGTTSMIYACDLEARFVFVNAALATLLETTPAQMLGRRRHELMPQEDADKHEANDREVIAAGRAVEFEEQSELRGRSITWLSTKFPLRDASGRIYAVAGIVTDITDRKRTEQALRESEERFRLMGDTIPYGAWMADAQGRNIYISPLFLELVGRTYEEVKELGWADKMPAEDVEPVMQRWMECVRTGQDWEGELRFPSPDGRWHTILSRGKPVRDVHGQVQAWVGINLDITERKEAEEGLARANAALAEADRRKNEFIAVLSHELRNPLAPIRYALPLLGEERLGAAGRRATEVIDRQVAQLSRLVDDLLDMSRITAGKFELRREHVTLRSVLSAAVEAASPAVAAAGHSLDISAPDSPVWLHADAARISQAITNLLNNSARYTPQGGCIRLEAHADQGHCVIRVTDNGIGIAPKALPTLFERFRQVHDKKGPQGGLGIGLALAKQLVEMHDGTIEAHSAGANSGAEFVIRLPLAAVAPGPQEPQARLCGETACLRVLVVDDNIDLVEVLAMVVEAAGHQARKAFDGRSAVSAALEYQPHVILLDVGMPEMDGTEVARELRRHPEMAGTRIIALTGWGQDDDRRRTAEAGFDEHLTKPTDPQQVLRILEQVAARTAT
jgi:two-component system, chemotaxis family, CheB/CheR fusion protein